MLKLYMYNHYICLFSSLLFYIFVDCGTFVYLCDFHRLQSWNRWLKASGHGIQPSRHEQLVTVLKSIGESYTDVEMNTCIKNLMEQPEWETNKSFRMWFQSHYLEKKRGMNYLVHKCFYEE